MPPFRLFGFLATLLCGTQLFATPASAVIAGCAAFGALVLARRFRAVLALALALGVLAAQIDDRRTSIGNRRADRERVLVTDRVDAPSGARLRLRRAVGPDLEAWLAPARPGRAACAAPPGASLIVSGTVVDFAGTRNPGGFSAAENARERGLGGRLRGFRCERGAAPDPWAVPAWPARLRLWGEARLRDALPARDAAIVAGVLLGAREDLDPAVRADFAATGTVHVLVTAGLHVGIAAAACLALLRRCGCGRATSAGLAAALVLAYALLAGWHLPARRAAIMTGLALLAEVCGTRVSSPAAYGVAAAVVLVLDPGAPRRLSFWLSFCCVGTLLALTGPLARRLRGLPRPLAQGAAVAIAAQLGTWPLVAYGMHAATLYGIAANCVVVPLTALLLPAGAASLALRAAADALGARTLAPLVLAHELALRAAGVLALLCRVLCAGMAGTAHVLAGLPGGGAIVGDPPRAVLVVYYGLVLAALAVVRLAPRFPDVVATLGLTRPCLTRADRARTAVALICAAQVLVAAAVLLPVAPRAEIVMLDVGQGDGLVLRSAEGATVVIDAGGKPGPVVRAFDTTTARLAGEAVLLPYLAHARVRRIDLLVLTHPHSDHTGAAAAILRAYPVGALAVGREASTDPGQNAALAAARARGVRIVRARRGMRFSPAGMRLDVLAPFAGPSPAHPSSSEVNEGSIVLRARVDAATILCMGDAGEPTETRLLAAGDRLRADILKLGHHGSNGASGTAFLAAVRPRAILISVGAENRFGHPARGALARAARTRARLLRTDRCGAIVLDAADRARLDATAILPCA